ncbi:MAG: UDP-N-acetylglucosamine 2-epimerase (non-hydrolyzing) [Elusimicrobia bacterium]|nr:UDP-N-acetylglucosamine 2-epimerase (non-hydrolyzing) [Elusimicrobiota bacterium]
MRKKKILVVFGTRPEAIKMAPVIAELKRRECFGVKSAVTAQHRGMLDQVLDLFGISPEYDLDIMTRSQTLHMIVSRCMEGLRKVYEKEKPDLVLVHGDTTTTLAAALSAYYLMIPAGHVEAGLRSFDMYNPFPEEQNRRLTDSLCTLHFAPTRGNRMNLLGENVAPGSVYVTGNTVIDALKHITSKGLAPENSALRKMLPGRKFVLVTAHRRENFGKPLENICRALKKLSGDFPDLRFVYPVHLNPNVNGTVRKMLGKNGGFLLVPPVSYRDMVWLMKNCHFCFTDSGGIQEEAPSLGKPVLVLRKVTERPEAVAAGTVKVIGTGEEEIYGWGRRILERKEVYRRFSRSVNPYGDGRAAVRTADAIEYWLGLRKKRPGDWKPPKKTR